MFFSSIGLAGDGALTAALRNFHATDRVRTSPDIDVLCMLSKVSAVKVGDVVLIIDDGNDPPLIESGTRM